jgi:hypothetical protein
MSISRLRSQRLFEKSGQSSRSLVNSNIHTTILSDRGVGSQSLTIAGDMAEDFAIWRGRNIFISNRQCGIGTGSN